METLGRWDSTEPEADEGLRVIHSGDQWNLIYICDNVWTALARFYDGEGAGLGSFAFERVLTASVRRRAGSSSINTNPSWTVESDEESVGVWLNSVGESQLSLCIELNGSGQDLAQFDNLQSVHTFIEFMDRECSSQPGNETVAEVAASWTIGGRGSASGNHGGQHRSGDKRTLLLFDAGAGEFVLGLRRPAQELQGIAVIQGSEEAASVASVLNAIASADKVERRQGAEPSSAQWTVVASSNTEVRLAVISDRRGFRTLLLAEAESTSLTRLQDEQAARELIDFVDDLCGIH